MLGHPKPRPHALVKRERKAAVSAQDEAESRKVRQRSAGRCEIYETAGMGSFRCHRRASEVHHMKDGIGVRGRGDSALAQWKQHLCADCHENIRLHVLAPVNPQANALYIVYQRVR